MSIFSCAPRMPLICACLHVCSTSDLMCPCMFVHIPFTPLWVALVICLVPQQVSTENELQETVASAQGDAKAPDVSTLAALGLPQPDFHSLILDLGALSFVDTVCLKSLKNVRGWGHP